ncbi:sigma-54-dependent Fis family transcriptional regulator [candidate division KSB1 bacterium]|nr:sigma-54-dependent Fis family transcriptional regulator [candidate division KSB1 bacterium]
MEEVVESILKQQTKKHDIEKINKYTATGKLRYYTLTLLPLADPRTGYIQLVCLIADTTTETAYEQEIQQQKYEILMLQSNLAKYGNHSSIGILGNSEKIIHVREFIKRLANVKNTTVLLQGKSGTGKNLVARAIHETSLTADGPFVEINCASIPATLLESEIFGYEKGAFTNALNSKNGLLEIADGGTFFLDEIGELPLSLQSKFLSFLEYKKFRRLGSTQENTVNVRIIAATNKDLKKAVENDEFREDLFYRLNVVATFLPDLHELGDDVIILAEHFINVYAYDFRKKIRGLTPSAREKLMAYSWPGNVRELRNVIERAIIFADGDRLDDKDLLLQEISPKPASMPGDISAIPDSGLSIAEMEKRFFFNAIRKAKGNQTKAAKLLGLSLDKFRYRMKKYNLDIKNSDGVETDIK